MATYFIFGAVGQCPACADHRFSGPATLAPETSVTCHRCGHACTIKTAIETALASGAVKKLSVPERALALQAQRLDDHRPSSGIGCGGQRCD
jgi:hypothetical protein